MGLVISGASGASGIVQPIVDVMEDWDGYNGKTNGNVDGQRSAVRSMSWLPRAPGNSLLSLLTGAPGGKSFDANVGRTVHTFASGGALAGIGGNSGSNSFEFPMYLKFQQAQSPPIALIAGLAPFRRYRVDFLARVTAIGTARAVCGAGQDSIPLLLSNNIAAVWSMVSTVNAGRWTPAVRLATAGPIVDGVDSGVASLNNWRLLSIQFDEGVVPRLTWLIDDRAVQTLSGDAALPAGTNFTCGIGRGISNPAGTTIQFLPCRYRVWELG